MEIIQRQITLPAPVDEVWGLLTDPDELATWLGDEVALDATSGATGHVVERDGTRRALVIDEVDPGRRLSWHWWPDDEQAAVPSHVEITLVPDTHGTTVRVIERLSGSAPIEARSRAADAWEHHLLCLEALLLVTAAVRG